MRRTEYLTEKRSFSEFTAEMLMEQEVVTCRPEDSARHVASELTKHNFGSLPVVDETKRLIGIISEFDLLKALMAGRDLKAVLAGEIMSANVRTVETTTPVDDVISLLETEHLIRVPVMKKDRLVGMLARRDILYGYIKATAQYWP